MSDNKTDTKACPRCKKVLNGWDEYPYTICQICLMGMGLSLKERDKYKKEGIPSPFVNSYARVVSGLGEYFKCDYCSFYTYDESVIREHIHMRMKDNPPTYYPCTTCGKNQLIKIVKGDKICTMCGTILYRAPFKFTDPFKYEDGTIKLEANDPVNPNHYKGRDVMDVINRYGLGFCLGNVVCYILREKRKNGLEDLKKAKWYLEEEIRIREEEYRKEGERIADTIPTTT